jgi:prepilin signal peptidase PulO-like enzyme (type II secretory pathway)
MLVAYLLNLLDLLEQADNSELAWFLTASIAALGASVGSFLNVVVYRLPRGMNLSHPGSRCPHCLHPIRWFDNVPVLGWLWLGGRCRDCHAPIAARYPLVETLVGALAAALFWLEVVERGANLPGPEFIGGETSPDLLWLRFGYHLLLALTLVAAGFIAFDRQRLPMRLWAPALVVGLIAPLVWPDLRPIPAFDLFAKVSGPLRGAIDGLAGLTLCANLGFMAIHPWRTLKGPLIAQSRDNQQAVHPTSELESSGRLLNRVLAKRDQAALAAIVGLFLGWQAAWGTLLLALTLDLVGTSLALNRRRGGASLLVWSSVAALAWLFEWRSITRWSDSAFGGVAGQFVCYMVAFIVLTNLVAGQSQADASHSPGA